MVSNCVRSFRTRQQKNGHPHRSTFIPKHLWKCVWKLKVPPKIRCFMWKTLQEAVANKANLFKCRSSPSPICPLCNSKEESMIHLFLQCPWVEEVWHGRMLTRGLRRGEVTSWANWLGVISDSVNG
ncbi:unnamed protein product [Malus baccata var. baccata]